MFNNGKAQSFEDNKQKAFVSLYISTKLPITTVYVSFKENDENIS